MPTRIMTDNFIDLDIVSNATVSSEQTAFPVANIYNFQRRSKVWRSNGFFEVTSSNKTIVFRETTSVDLTATLTEAEYNSDSEFFAHIKARMEAVGGSTYTVSRDTSTLRIKIESDLAGGGGIFEIDWTTSTAADTLGFDTAAEDTGASSYTADVLRIHTQEWIKWDMGISTNPEAFIMIGKRNEPIAITPSATIKLQGNETDIWTSPSFEQTLTYNDPVMSSFRSDSATGLHTEALRYWRLEVTDIDNAQGFIELGAVFLGNFFQATQGAVQFPFSGELVDRSPTVFSEGGQSFSDEFEKTERFSITWFALSKSEMESIFTIWDDVGTSRPFFVQFDTQGGLNADTQFFIRYVKFQSNPQYQLVRPNIYQVSMQLREEL